MPDTNQVGPDVVEAITPSNVFLVMRVLTVITLALLGSDDRTEHRTATSDPVTVSAQQLIAYKRRTIAFEANVGQAAPEVKFLARGQGYTLLLTASELVVGLKKPTATADSPIPDRATTIQTNASLSAAVRMKLVGSKPHTQVEGIDALAARSNYFIGNNPASWLTNVPTYARVRFTDVYPGIDLDYHGNQDDLEYDFVLAPGADPDVIRMRFPDVEGIRIDATNDLLLALGRDGAIRLRKPFVYQEAEKGTTRHEIAGEYVLGHNAEVGFKIGKYDTSLPLIIDPVLAYSTYLGGTGHENTVSVAGSIAVDTAGSAYVTGLTLSTDFPTTKGAFQTSCANCQGFVTKFDASGSIVYSTYLGGSAAGHTGIPFGIAVDRHGATYVTGGTSAPDFPTTPGAFQTECPVPLGSPTGLCLDSAFVTKLDSSGSALVYSTFLAVTDPSAGIGSDGSDVAVDDSLNAVIVGAAGPDFPVTPGVVQPINHGRFDGFVAKLNATGSALVYATYLGGQHDDMPAGVAIDELGSAYVTGTANSFDFPTTPGAFQRTCPIGDLLGYCSIAFVAKLSDAGTSLEYSTFLGGFGEPILAIKGVSSFGRDVAVDQTGHAYVTGSARTTDFPTTPGALKPTSMTVDAFVTKLSHDGAALEYSTLLGGDSSGDDGNGIAIDSEGSAYVIGTTGSTDFPIVNGFQTVYGGQLDAFVAKLNADGGGLIYSTYLGGADQEYGLRIAIDSAGAAHVIGSTRSGNFPTVNPSQAALAGPIDMFVAKLGEQKCPADVTGQLSLFQSRFYAIPFTRFRFQWAVIVNRTADSVQGPLAFVMADLQNAIFIGSRAKTRCFSPEGDPFTIVSVGGDHVLGPNELALAGLWFFKTQEGPISYVSHVLAGLPNQ